MRLTAFLRHLGLGIGSSLLLIGLAGIQPAPAVQSPSAPSLILPLATSARTPVQLLQDGRDRYQMGQFSEAAIVWQKAATGFETAGDSLNQAMALSNLSLAYQQLGQRPLAQAAIETSLQLLGCPASGLSCPTDNAAQTKIQAQALTTLGSLQLSQGQGDLAFATWQRAVVLYQRVNDTAGVVRTQINQTQALRAAGLYPRAQALLQQISQSLAQQSDPAVKIAGLISYGDALRLVGDWQQSQTPLQEALKLAQQYSAADIAPIYLSLGNTARAQMSADRSVTAQSLAKILPSMEIVLGHYQKAIDNASTPAIKVQAQLNQLNFRVEALSGPAFQTQAQLDPDQEPVDQAPRQAAREQSRQAAHTLAQQILPQLANLPLSHTKLYSQINYAATLIQLVSKPDNAGYGGQCRGKTLASQASSAVHPARELTDRSQASTKALDKLDKPGSLAATTIPSPTTFAPLATAATVLADALQQSRTLQDWQSESFALGYLGQVYETNGQCAEALPLTRQALALAQSHRAVDLTYRWEWQTGRLYRDLATAETQAANQEIAEDNPNYASAIAAYRGTFKALQSLRRDLAAGSADAQFDFQDQTQEPIYREFIDLLLRPDAPSQKNLKEARTVIESLQIAELENFLQEPCVVSNPKAIDTVTDKVGHTAALYPIVLKNRVEVILKLPRQEDLVHYRSRIPEAEVRETLKQFNLKLQSDEDYETVKTEAQKVYAWLIEKARTQLDATKIDTLVFVPDSKLRSVPMAALYDGKQYLVENFATTVALNLAIQSPKPLPKQPRVLGASLTDPPPSFKKRNFTSLSNVTREIKAIAQPGITVVPIQDKNFTTDKFNRKINESSFSIVHLATHGQFSSDPQNTFIITADGDINVNELGQLFRTRGLNRTDEIELLILSACETASGDSRAALGIAGTAVRAGARSAIASLWSLDDASTVDLMAQFYKKLGQGTVSRAQALREAQLSLLRSQQSFYPRLWAPLILLGNWL